MIYSIKKFSPAFLISAFISVLIMVAIFKFSSQNGTSSSSISSRVTEIIVENIFSDYNKIPEQTQTTIIQELHGFIRKTAHFSIYFLLGASVFITIKNIINRLKNQLIFSFSICLIYAVSDEIHQSFISERNGNITDVLIDIWGSVCGIFVILLLLSIIFYIKNIHQKR